MMLRRAVEQLYGQEYAIPAGSSLANKLGQYAELLATEGSLHTALGYLTGTSQVGEPICRFMHIIHFCNFSRVNEVRQFIY